MAANVYLLSRSQVSNNSTGLKYETGISVKNNSFYFRVGDAAFDFTDKLIRDKGTTQRI